MGNWGKLLWEYMETKLWEIMINYRAQLNFPQFPLISFRHYSPLRKLAYNTNLTLIT